MDIRVCILKKETMDKVTEYLVSRPYQEVTELLAHIHLDTTSITPDMIQPPPEEVKEEANA